MHAPGNRLQPCRAVIDGVHRRDVCQQRLRRADVRSRLLASDVLFAGLERHAIGAAAAGVDRQADDPAGRLSDERLARRKECGVRAAVAERHAESLRVADDGVGAHLAGRYEQRQREQVGRRPRPARRLPCARSISGRGSCDLAVIVGILQQQPERTCQHCVRACSPAIALPAGCRAARRGRAARRASAGNSNRRRGTRSPAPPAPSSSGADGTSSSPRPAAVASSSSDAVAMSIAVSPSPRSGSSAVTRAGPGRSPPDTGCTACTSRDSRIRCAGSRSASRSRSSPYRCTTAS